MYEMECKPPETRPVGKVSPLNFSTTRWLANGLVIW